MLEQNEQKLIKEMTLKPNHDKKKDAKGCCKKCSLRHNRNSYEYSQVIFKEKKKQGYVITL